MGGRQWVAADPGALVGRRAVGRGRRARAADVGCWPAAQARVRRAATRKAGAPTSGATIGAFTQLGVSSPYGTGAWGAARGAWAGGGGQAGGGAVQQSRHACQCSTLQARWRRPRRPAKPPRPAAAANKITAHAAQQRLAKRTLSALITASAISYATSSCASLVLAPRCGVQITSGRPTSGLSGGRAAGGTGRRREGALGSAERGGRAGACLPARPPGQSPRPAAPRCALPAQCRSSSQAQAAAGAPSAGGSTSNTSSAAPATTPASSARTSDASSITPPRATFTMRAPFFICTGGGA